MPVAPPLTILGVIEKEAVVRNSRFRFLIIAVGIFTLLFGLSTCAKKELSPDTALSVLPKDAAFVLSANVKKFAETGLFKEMMKDPKNLEGYNKFIATTGINPEKDIERIVVAGSFGDQAQKNIALAAFGNFDKDKILAGIKKEGGDKLDLVMSNYEGTELYKVSEQQEPFSMGFINPRCMVAGGEEGIRKLIDLNKGKGESIEKNAELMALLKGIDQKSMMWGGGLIPPELSQKASGNPFTASLASVKSVVFSVNMGDAFDLNLLGNSDTEQNAKQVSDLLKSFISIGKMTQSGKPSVMQAFDALIIGNKGNTVTVSIHLSKELMEKISQEAKSEVESKIKEVQPQQAVPQGEPLPQGEPQQAQPESQTVPK